ncbi:MAG: hypothetical protein JNM93_01230 [Bacteriovoracaceae bacterium]|nr:hypothetical protein [Bacteriovoracaceae bacterium]
MKKLIFLLLVCSCARMTGLNLKEHHFGVQPKKIIWIQLAGFDENMMSLLKFHQSNPVQLESFSCLGKTWSYDLYRLRASSYQGFLSEVTHSKNIKNNCEDYDRKPIWQTLEDYDYKTVILENPVKPGNSLIQSTKCEKNNFLNLSTVFTMQANNDEKANHFHSGSNLSYSENKIYYDKSCQQNKCFSPLSANVISIYEKSLKNKDKYLYMIRDFSLEDGVARGSTPAMKSALNEFEALLAYFTALQKNDPEFLILVTSSSAIGVDLPMQGEDWQKLELDLTGSVYKNRLLMSPVFAKGARSENFCGLFEQSDVYARLLSSPKQQGLKLLFLNPF